LAVDIGGTFVDVALAAPGGTVTAKVLGGARPLDAVAAGVAEVLERGGVHAADVGRVLHATTLATNAVLERRGALTAFVTTAGFGDMLALGRQGRSGVDRYDLWAVPTEPLVPRERCVEVRERMTASGVPALALDPAEAAAVARAVAATRPEAVAVCLLHAYANPAHERAVAEALRAELPGALVVASHEVWCEPREYERASTTVVSAYVGPVLAGYLAEFSGCMAALGIDAPVYVLDSSGGLMSPESAARLAVRTVESGPAAGVLTAAAVARAAGRPDAVAFDMGGTTAKAGVVHGGEPTVTRDFQVGGQASAGGRQGGVPVKIPTMDLAEVGSGGGSVAWVDASGALRVGPRSQGADPGPACYGRGGTLPTVTDADLVLGYLGDAPLAGGSLPVDRAAAEAAFDRLGAELGVDRIGAAAAVFDVANLSMGYAIHVVTVQRGLDPRRFVLVATGGAGPVHAARVAERFEVDTVVVPEHSGAASATGLLQAVVAAERVAALPRAVQLGPPAPGPGDAALIDALCAAVEEQLVADLSLRSGARVERSVLARYRGQAHELAVRLSAGQVDDGALAAAGAALRDLHHERYGTRPTGPVEAVGVLVRVAEHPRGRDQAPGPARFAGAGPAMAASEGTRPVWLAELGGWVDLAVYRRQGIAPGAQLQGPAVVEEPGSTVLVPPGWSARVDVGHRLVLHRGV
jgi:N-methylhydantoinase A